MIDLVRQIFEFDILSDLLKMIVVLALWALICALPMWMVYSQIAWHFNLPQFEYMWFVVFLFLFGKVSD